MNYVFSILILIAVYSLLSVSLDLIMGHGGMFHMGHGGFFAVGAYAGALLATSLNLPFFLEILLAGVVAAVFGMIIGFPSIRLKGDYITFCSYGFAVVIYTVANNWMDVTNGPIGISGIMRPEIFGISFASLPMYLLICVVICAVCFFIIYRILNSPYGKSIQATREDEIATYACGVNVASLRVQIFCIGAFFAGVAGVMYIHYMMLCDPTGFKVATSSLLVSMVIIGGMGSMKGAIAGAVLVIGVPELLGLLGLPSNYTEQIQNILYSLLLIIIIIKRPQGLFGKLKC